MAFSNGCGTPPTACSALKKSSPDAKMQRSPSFPEPVGSFHHSVISLESDYSSTTVVEVCEDSIMIR
jgi:hypothetical protein